MLTNADIFGYIGFPELCRFFRGFSTTGSTAPNMHHLYKTCAKVVQFGGIQNSDKYTTEKQSGEEAARVEQITNKLRAKKGNMLTTTKKG